METLTAKTVGSQVPVHKPTFFDLSQEADKNALDALLESNPTIEVLDEIQGQLEEFVKLRNPRRKYSAAELKSESIKHIGSTPMKNYGNWVYYPWLNKVVHILGEEEFIEVRTNRNQYKITPEEEEILAGKKLGVIGLSVGKAIALTIALERICGEIVIADFDIIELSNLNRIQTGVQNFGIKKTVVVSREISEIDPYLKVTCYHEGVTRNNVDDFFLKDGRLDICIEVCDGLATKILARQKAKELHIPVVMNSSDRGCTDIERFDLDPSLPILHGLVDHLDLDLAYKAKTNEEKVPYLLPMLGVETSSERLKASMIEIEDSITTWPQLASGVIFGGGICTDVCRRILLNQFSNSGRYFVDTEQEINDDVTDYISARKVREERIEHLPKTSLADYADVLNEANSKLFKDKSGEYCNLSNQEVEDLVEFACMAPSGGNVQPWKWLYKDGHLMLFNDAHRSASILNYKNTGSLLSFGAATENLILRAHALGYEVAMDKFPLGLENDLVVTFRFYKRETDQTVLHVCDKLFPFVQTRVTNRMLSERTPLSEQDTDYLKEMVTSVPGAEMRIFSDPEQMSALRDILSEVDKLFMTNKTGHGHFMKELRWSKREVEETRDGVDLETVDLTPAERAGIVVAKNWNVTKHIKKWRLGSEFGKMSMKAVDAASTLGVITMPKFGFDEYFEGGRAMQRMWLAATEKDIALQPMAISTFLFARVGDNNFDDIEEIGQDLLGLYNKMKGICSLDDSAKDVFFFRLAKAKQPKVLALRRHVKDVLMYEE